MQIVYLIMQNSFVFDLLFYKVYLKQLEYIYLFLYFGKIKYILFNNIYEIFYNSKFSSNFIIDIRN
jgi:hypothetical protein